MTRDTWLPKKVILLLAVDAMSAFGYQVGGFACTWAILSSSTETIRASGHTIAFWIAALTLVSDVTLALMHPIAGIALDTMQPKRAMVYANVLLAAAFAILGLLISTRASYAVWLIAMAIIGCLTPFSETGGFVLLPSLVTGLSLERANGLGEIFFQSTTLAGPIVSSFLVRVVKTPATLLVTSATFFTLSVVLGRMNLRLTRVNKEPNGRDTVTDANRAIPFFKQLVSSTRYMIHRRPLLVFTVLAFALNVELGIEAVSLPLWVRSIHGNAMELALVFSASAAGMALGALTVTFLLDGIEKARLSFALVIQFALMMMLLFFIRDAWMVIAVLGAAGFVFGAFPPMARSIVQRSIPENIRGSVLGTRMMLLSLSSPCGAALAAWLVSTMHVSPLTSVACAATTVLAVALALWIWTPTSALVQ